MKTTVFIFIFRGRLSAQKCIKFRFVWRTRGKNRLFRISRDTHTHTLRIHVFTSNHRLDGVCTYIDTYVKRICLYTLWCTCNRETGRPRFRGHVVGGVGYVPSSRIDRSARLLRTFPLHRTNARPSPNVVPFSAQPLPGSGATRPFASELFVRPPPSHAAHTRPPFLSLPPIPARARRQQCSLHVFFFSPPAAARLHCCEPALLTSNVAQTTVGRHHYTHTRTRLRKNVGARRTHTHTPVRGGLCNEIEIYPILDTTNCANIPFVSNANCVR